MYPVEPVVVAEEQNLQVARECRRLSEEHTGSGPMEMRLPEEAR
jgi:hypothetical protein